MEITCLPYCLYPLVHSSSLRCCQTFTICWFLHLNKKLINKDQKCTSLANYINNP